MTIEEKVENFRTLLKRSYQAQKKEDILISVEVLEASGLSRRELKEVICPSLISEGLLRGFALDFPIPVKENLTLHVAQYDTIKHFIDDLEFTADIPSYGFTVNIDKLNKKFSIARKSTQPIFNLPQGSDWKDITIKFKDEENIDVIFSGKPLASMSFQQMGFGKKNPNPKWSFLWCLAVIYVTHGQLDKELKDRYGVPAEPADLAKALTKQRKKHFTKEYMHTIKKALSLKLQEDFGIFTDPFEEDYTQWKYYRTKFELLPEALFRAVKSFEADKPMRAGVERIKHVDPTLREMDGRSFSSIGSDDSLESADDITHDGRLSDESNSDDEDAESADDDVANNGYSIE